MLNEVETDGVPHYRCRTGHEYSPAGLFLRQDDALERALWEAVRALEERADMSRRLAERLRRRNLAAAAERLERQATAALERSELVRAALEDLSVQSDSTDSNDVAMDA